MISVIIPLYNKENYIRETLSSVLSQSYRDFEIVVVNDGSKDNSVAVVESIKDSRIRIINKDNEGVSKTRNRGIQEAKGEWVLFLDADDVMVEGCLQSLVELGEQFPEANVLSGNFITRTEELDINSSTITEKCLISNPYELIWKKKWHFRLGSFMAKRYILPMFSEHIAKGEDFLFFVEMQKSSIIAHTPHTTIVYVLENASLSRKVLPIEKCMSWNLVFEDTNTYLKSIYIDLLWKSMIVYAIRYKKISFSLRLIKRYFKELLVFTPLCWYRKMFSIKL